MNTIRNFFKDEVEELRPLLRAAYAAILRYQSERDDINEAKMRKALRATLPIISPFKAHIPVYKRRYIEILEDQSDALTTYDLIVCFDRAIYELHTRLQCGDYSHLPWSETLRELFEERRRINKTEATPPFAPAPEKAFLTQGSAVTNRGATGPARVVLHPRDLYRVQTGDILVTTMSDPDFIRVADRIAGMITDFGGLVCHAAILAREWNLPCIVGCQNATTTITDGQTICMDGATGAVTADAEEKI